MLNNSGMTLVEVLIGCFVFAVVSTAFTTGLFMVISLTNATADRQIMERAAEEIILLGDAYDINYLNDRDFDSMEYFDYAVDIEITSPLVDDPLTSKIYGRKLTATVGYGPGFEGEDAELFDFIFEGLDND